MTSRQLNLMGIDDAVDDAPAPAPGLPLIIPAWELREEGHAQAIVLVAPPRYHVDPLTSKIGAPEDTKRCFPVQIACPEGWTVEPGPAGGVGMFVDATGNLVATATAIALGQVKVIETGPLPDYGAAAKSRETWGGKG